MNRQGQEVGAPEWDEQAAAYRAFVQDARAAGVVDLMEDSQEPVAELSPREVEALYRLPKPLVDLDSLPVIQGERACRTQPSRFLIDRYDDGGNERSKSDIDREVAAAKQICRSCIALTSCRPYADAVQAAMPPRSRDDRKSHLVVMAGVAYAQ
jgi:hypothetical protein